MSAELRAFLLSGLCGIFAMLLWDAFHGLRRVFFKGIVCNTLLDIIWWFTAASLFYRAIWETVSLSLRFFELFAAFIGIILYTLTVSKLLRRCFCNIFGLVFKIIKFILKILLTPTTFLDKIIEKMFF